MKKRFRLFLALCALGAALASGTTGCTSVNVSHEGGRTLVDISNSGWLLLNFIPLASGCPEHPLAHHCKLFQNSVTLENNMKLLDYAVRREGARRLGQHSRGERHALADDHQHRVVARHHHGVRVELALYPGDDAALHRLRELVAAQHD